MQKMRSKLVRDSRTKAQKWVKNHALEHLFSLEGVALVGVFCKIILRALTYQASKSVSSKLGK
jgi:hypothetical protein